MEASPAMEASHAMKATESLGGTVDLPQVSAVLNYLVPMSDKPRSLAYEPPPGVPQTNMILEGHKVDIHDVRPISRDLSLDREGIRLVARPSAVRDFYDEDEVRRT